MWKTRQIKLEKERIKTNKIVIYTAIIGEYDRLIEPKYIDQNCDYICFTDNKNLTSNIWKIRVIDESEKEKEETKTARKYKILPHRYLKEYKYSVWIDGNFEIVGSVRKYISTYLKDADILCIKHPERNCIYEEVQACINLKKDDENIMSNQVDSYFRQGYPEDNGLIVSSILFRKHNKRSMKFLMEQWWEEVSNKSRRDQLSFDYIFWKNKKNYDQSYIKWKENKYFIRKEHVKQVTTDGRQFFIEPTFNIPKQKMIDIGGITEDREIVQIFRANNDILSKLEIQFATYCRINNSSLEIILGSKNQQEILFKEYIHAKELKDNEMYSIILPNIEVNRNEDYFIKIKAVNVDENNAITLYRTTELEHNINHYAIIDGKRQQYTLNMEVWGRDKY